MDDELAVSVPISRDCMGLDVAVLDRRQGVNIFHDFVGFGEAAFDISAGSAVDAVNIAARRLIDMVFVNNGGAGFSRFQYVGDSAEFFILDIDQRESLLCDLTAVGGNRRDDIPDVARFVDDTGWSSTPVPK